MKAFESRALFIYSPQLMWMKHPVTLSTANLNGRSNMRLCPVGGVRSALASSMPNAGRASYRPRAVHGLSGGFYGEKPQMSHQADREIQYPGCKALAPSLSISLPHQNLAVIPPADTVTLPCQGWHCCLRCCLLPSP